MNSMHFCIICGETFIPSHPDEVRCPEHGGEGRLVGDSEPANEPQRTKLDPVEPGEPTRMDDGGQGQPTKLDAEPQGTLVDGDPSLSGEKPPISLGEEGEDVGDDDEPVQTEDDVPVAWKAGDRILDLYEVKGTLGEGGFGIVHRVYHTAWDLDLAVKSPLRSELKKGGTEDFVSEAEDWMDLGLHPHITTCHYVRTLGGVPRVFAELVEGGSLHKWMVKGRLYEGSEEEILKRLLDIAVQFAWGLDYAHEEGMIHQDVKPENVLMTEGGMVKVTDFGLVSAKAVDGEVEVRAEEQGEKKTVLVKGRGMTPAYCSPEQSMGKLLSRRTDLWSWGLSILALFAGERFWGQRAQWATGPLAEDSLNHYLEEGPKRAGIPRMPEGVVSLLQEVFQQDPDQRPHDMDVAAQRVIEVYEEELGEPYPREKPEAAELRADSLNNRALSLMDLGREKEAEETWKQALEVDSHHPQTTYNYGLHRWRSVKIDDQELVSQLSEVVNAQPNAWKPRYLMALVHMERDDCQGAIEVLESIPQGLIIGEEVDQLMAQARAHLPDSTRCILTFQGHQDSVTSVHLSADGRHVLSGSYNKTLKLWDMETGECLRTFVGHRDPVNAVHLSADGRYALSGSGDSKISSNNALKLWDVETGECLRTFQGHESYVRSVYLSVDGCLALSGSTDKTLKLWDVVTGECLRTLKGHGGWVNSVHLSADGGYALSGSGGLGIDKTLKLWDVESGECLRTFQGHESSVNSVHLSADGHCALSGSADKTLKLWDVETGVCLCTFQGHEGWVTSVHLSADGRYALSGSYDHTLKLWDVDNGKCLRTFQGHGTVNSVQLSADGNHALSGSGDKTLKLWRISLGDIGFQAPVQVSRVVKGEGALEREKKFQELLAQSRKERQNGCVQKSASLVQEARSIPGYARNPNALEAWSALYSCLPRKFQAGWEVRTFEGHEDGVSSVYLSADGRYALSGSRDKTLKLWDVETGECLRTFKGHETDMNSVHLSADGRQVLSGSEDSTTLKLWDVDTGACLRTFEGHASNVHSVHLSADGRHALSGSYDRTLKLWDVETGVCLRTFKGHGDGVTSVHLSADGKRALSGSYDKTLKLWDVETGKCLQTFEGHEDYVNSVYLNTDGRYALSGSGVDDGNDHTLKLWDVDTGACLRTFLGHESIVCSVQLSADGRYAFSGSWDNTLRLWEVETGKCLRTFPGHEDWVTSVHLSADGRYALSGSSDNTLKLWFLGWEMEAKEPADWDEGARPYLENFLILHTPYAGKIPQDREPTEEEIQQALTREGTPTWTEEDFQGLITKLGYAGYGWLRPEGVRRKLNELAEQRE